MDAVLAQGAWRRKRQRWCKTAGEEGVENNTGVSLLNMRFFPSKRLHDSLELKSCVNGPRESLSVCLGGLSQARVLQGEFGVINGMGNGGRNAEPGPMDRTCLAFSPSSLFHLDSVKSIRILIP